jgi:hypothetical protein
LDEEMEELLEGEDPRALGIAQNECRLDCCPLDWELERREEKDPARMAEGGFNCCG